MDHGGRWLASLLVIAWVAAGSRMGLDALDTFVSAAEDEVNSVGEVEPAPPDDEDRWTPFYKVRERLVYTRPQRIKREEVIDKMVRINCKGESTKMSGIPQDFAGLWWQDNIKLSPERVVSFGHAKWTPGARGCDEKRIFFYKEDERQKGIIRSPFGDEVPCRGRMTFFAWEERSWAYTDEYAFGSENKTASMPLSGYQNLRSFAGINAQSIMVCGGKDPNYLTVCKLVPLFSRGGMVTQALETFASTYVLPYEYHWVRVSKDVWARYTPYPKALGAVFNMPFNIYYVKRIATCDGKEGPYWKHFLSDGKASNARMPRTDAFGHPLNYSAHVARVPERLWLNVNRRNPEGASVDNSDVDAIPVVEPAPAIDFEGEELTTTMPSPGGSLFSMLPFTGANTLTGAADAAGPAEGDDDSAAENALAAAKPRTRQEKQGRRQMRKTTYIPMEDNRSRRSPWRTTANAKYLGNNKPH